MYWNPSWNSPLSQNLIPRSCRSFRTPKSVCSASGGASVLGRRCQPSVDGEGGIAETQVLAEVDVLDARAHAGGVPVEEVADVDGFALVVAGPGPGRPSEQPRDARDVGVEVGEGHHRARRGREAERRIDGPVRRVANEGRRDEDGGHEVRRRDHAVVPFARVRHHREVRFRPHLTLVAEPVLGPQLPGQREREAGHAALVVARAEVAPEISAHRNVAKLRLRGGDNDGRGRRRDGLGRQDGRRLLGFFGFFGALPGIFLCVRESLGEGGRRQDARTNSPTAPTTVVVVVAWVTAAANRQRRCWPARPRRPRPTRSGRS